MPLERTAKFLDERLHPLGKEEGNRQKSSHLSSKYRLCFHATHKSQRKAYPLALLHSVGPCFHTVIFPSPP